VEELKTQHSCDDTTYQILDVSIDGVDAFYQNLEKDNVCNYFIHLGVSGAATCFNLETCGYNCDDFRVPDESGNQPCKECIVVERELNSSLSTSLNLADMKRKLAKAVDAGTAAGATTGTGNTMDGGQGQTDHTDVCISTDPGRFLCNHVYYRSLSHCLALQNTGTSVGDSDATTGGLRSRSTALFVHVPPVEVIPLKTQLDFVLRLLQWVKDQARESLA